MHARKVTVGDRLDLIEALVSSGDVPSRLEYRGLRLIAVLILQRMWLLSGSWRSTFVEDHQ